MPSAVNPVSRRPPWWLFRTGRKRGVEARCACPALSKYSVIRSCEPGWSGTWRSFSPLPWTRKCLTPPSLVDVANQELAELIPSEGGVIKNYRQDGANEPAPLGAPTECRA